MLSGKQNDDIFWASVQIPNAKLSKLNKKHEKKLKLQIVI